MTDPTTFANRLKAERKRVGLSQADAALIGGISREQWNRYESGVSPNSDVLIRLMGHGFDVNYILGGAATLTAGTLSPHEERLVECYRGTDDDGRVSIDRIAHLEWLRVHNGRAPTLHEPPAPASKALPRRTKR